MIDEQTTEMLIERLTRRVEQANTFFLTKIGSSLKKIKYLKPSEAQQLIQILKYGGSYEDIIRQLAKYTDLDVREVRQIIKQYAKKDQMFYKQFYEYRKVPFVPYETNTTLQKQTEALTNIIQNEMYNYMRNNVLGYTIRDLEGNLRHLGLREVYNQLLDTAYLTVGQGKETFDSAMTRILKDIGTSGLKTINYESGRSVRLDSAVRMHLKGRLRELHNENQKLFGKEFGADGVEISVHLNPAPDHQYVQGRQFSFEQYDKLQNGQDAVDYKGNVYNLDHDGKNGHRPISEMNCYHYKFDIILGSSKPEYNDKQLQQIIDSNNEGFEFEGKHYTNYQGTQLQRNLERRIREQKDVQILARESDNKQLINQSQQNITKLTRKYKQLSDASGLPTKAKRMKVSGYKRVKVSNVETKSNLQSFDRSKFKQYNIEAPARDYPKYKEDFDFPSNKYLDDYVSQGQSMRKTMLENEQYRKQMYDDAKGMDELKRPVKENIVLFSGQNLDRDLTKSDFVISTSFGEVTAHSYAFQVRRNVPNMGVVKIYVEKGANVISTANANSIHFSRQGEIIIPISEIKNLVKLNNTEYILKKELKK